MARTPIQAPSPDPGFAEVSQSRRAAQAEPRPLGPSDSRQAPPGPLPNAGLRPALPPMPDLQARAAPDSGPTIQVSIGRIEVRAASGHAPPPARSAPRPLVMSLEEYLKSRSNGDAR